MLIDYTETLERLQRGLGKAYEKNPSVLNIPGKSIAVKVDPNYYLAIMPSFQNRIAEWAGVFPEKASKSLVHTGNIACPSSSSPFSLQLGVQWGEPLTVRTLLCAFVSADFIDQALKIYAKRPAPLPVADIYLLEAQQSELKIFFGNKTFLDKTAFKPQI